MDKMPKPKQLLEEDGWREDEGDTTRLIMLAEILRR